MIWTFPDGKIFPAGTILTGGDGGTELLPGCFVVAKAESNAPELRPALGLLLDLTLAPAEVLLDLRCTAAEGAVDFKDLAAEEAAGLEGCAAGALLNFTAAGLLVGNLTAEEAESLHFAAEGIDRPESVFFVTGARPTDSDELELKLLVLVVVAAEVSPLGGVRSGVFGDPRSALSCLLFSKCNDLRRSLSAAVSCSRTCLIAFNIVW